MPAELERALRVRAEAADKSIDTNVAELIVGHLAEPEPLAAKLPRRKSQKEFVARLRRVAGRHRGPGDVIDDNRESIYTGPRK